MNLWLCSFYESYCQDIFATVISQLSMVAILSYFPFFLCLERYWCLCMLLSVLASYVVLNHKVHILEKAENKYLKNWKSDIEDRYHHFSLLCNDTQVLNCHGINILIGTNVYQPLQFCMNSILV